MAGTLSTILTAYRAALVTAGFVHVPSAVTMRDLPVSKMNKTFSLGLGTFLPRTAGVFGGGHVDYEATGRLELHWNAQLSEEAVQNTIADDLETVGGVMVKASNRQTGQLTVLWGPMTVSRVSEQEWKAEGDWQVAFRLTQTVT